MVKNVEDFLDLVSDYNLKFILFCDIVVCSYRYVESLVRKYGFWECEKLDFVCYFNFNYYYEIFFEKFFEVMYLFRLFVIVSNRYRVVIYVIEDVFVFLWESVGKVWDIVGE